MASDERHPQIHPQTRVNAAVNKQIVLASASPRRQQLLSYIVEQFTIAVADVDETPKKSESAYDLVERLAQMKAQFISDKILLDPRATDVMVIGSDTVVAKADAILGKPTDYNDFRQMMKTLSDNYHQVYTGVCVVCGDVVLHDVIITQVLMSEITKQDMADYWATNEPQDKAGGYAIQGIGGKFVKEIKGSFSAVVGLPLFETKHLIAQMQEKLKN